MTHNLDEGLGESFQFILNGNTYTMRYPTPAELRKILDEKKEEALVDKVAEYVTQEDGVPSLKDALDNTNVRKTKRFLKMITEEFTSEN